MRARRVEDVGAHRREEQRHADDEGELHSMAVALAGTDFMQSETATQSWLQTHVRDYVLDSVLKSSKLHQVFETANEWTISWGMMNHYLVSVRIETKNGLGML